MKNRKFKPQKVKKKNQFGINNTHQKHNLKKKKRRKNKFMKSE